ncbi:MAG: PilZ domain-containing protein [Bryobacteraceae bacterium]
MPPKTHLRRHARLPFNFEMRVSWKDARGLVQKLRAKCLDISAEGARLETDTPIPARAAITLDSPLYGNLGAASVRHCVRQNLKYSIGVEFTSALALAGPARRRCMQDLQPPVEPGP